MRIVGTFGLIVFGLAGDVVGESVGDMVVSDIGEIVVDDEDVIGDIILGGEEGSGDAEKERTEDKYEEGLSTKKWSVRSFGTHLN